MSIGKRGELAKSGPANEISWVFSFVHVFPQCLQVCLEATEGQQD